ncbi:MAG TPA: hypothetical protein VK116_18600, partial [Planctomycetota bacterium]|nr:hypothetical protein [Planctomycetota bacterium]
GKVAKTFVGLQSLYDLEVAAVNLLNQKILADSEAAKRKAAAKEDGGDAKKSTEKAAGSSS